MDNSFSLKDQLFNRSKVSHIAHEIHAVYPAFKRDSFIEQVVARFPDLELKQRISWIAESLTPFLPGDFVHAMDILLRALPPECDPTRSDDDFGDFIYAPYSEFVVKNGCNSTHLFRSLQALRTITTRFSAEDAIRYFINDFPEETMDQLSVWARDPHYHVRRLASEGTRPKLPWSPKIAIDPLRPLPILDCLFADRTRYVTRSVANHLNDLSKTHPDLVISRLNQWQQSGQQSSKEMAFIIRHALRTLIKQGYSSAIEFLGVSPTPQITLSEFQVVTTRVKMGDSVHFKCTILSHSTERLIVDYRILFQSKTGTLSNKKVYKWKQFELQTDTTATIEKRHPLRANMTTRALYPGRHVIELIINGTVMAQQEFDLF
ncbi:DNA alkylation repair protein [bacterium]|nr:DNA alkylation repair protein [bacterium]